MKTTKTLLVSLFLFLGTSAVFGQSLTPWLISTAGSHDDSSGGTLSWSVGELAITTLEGDEHMITQGFHQGSLDIETTYKMADTDYELHTYPNPARDYVTIEVNHDSYEHLHFTLLDIHGSKLKGDHLKGYTTRLSVQSLNSGIYFLNIADQNTIIQTFRITKQ